MKLRAVIFDLDGTLIDTEKLNVRFWMEAGKNLGFDIRYEDVLHIRSLAAPLAESFFREKFGDSFSFAEVREERRRLMREYVAEFGIEAKPHVIEILQYLRGKGIKTAVATASAKEHMEEYLRMIGAYDLIDMKISASMVKNGKPAPDIYIYACKELGFDPGECVAVEDSPNGVKSAHAAGCKTVFVRDLTPADDEIISKTIARIETLGGLEDIIR